MLTLVVCLVAFFICGYSLLFAAETIEQKFIAGVLGGPLFWILFLCAYIFVVSKNNAQNIE